MARVKSPLPGAVERIKNGKLELELWPFEVVESGGGPKMAKNGFSGIATQHLRYYGSPPINLLVFARAFTLSSQFLLKGSIFGRNRKIDHF